MDGQSGASSPRTLQDTFGRTFPYVRLSITDVCNFRCQYCLPNGYQCSGAADFLRRDEIGRLVAALAALGVRKIRLTGGEPTVRPDFTEIVRCVAAHPAIEHTAFTTNGYRLKDNAKIWYEAGARLINVSVDSLRPERFARITGHDRLNDVLAGIDAALEAGFEAVKVNVVLLKDVNDDELVDILDWARRMPISIRFIELMETGDHPDYFRAHHVSADVVRAHLLQAGWTHQARGPAAGPAQVYTHADYRGSIGLIAPYSTDFCTGCNRLRVTARGDLRLCLFGNTGVSLRHLLQDDAQQPLLEQLIANQLAEKRISHFLASGDTGLTKHLASIGG